MSAGSFLALLAGSRQTGPGRWLARCPAHEDKSPSLSVREVDDGRVLCHCFGGCSVAEVLSAVGLEFDALFPDRPIENGKPIRKAFPAGDVLEAIASEVRIAAICSADIRGGKALPATDHARLMLAAERIEAARTLANG